MMSNPHDFDDVWFELSPNVYVVANDCVTSFVTEDGAVELTTKNVCVHKTLRSLESGFYLRDLRSFPSFPEIKKTLAYLVRRNWVITEDRNSFYDVQFSQVRNWLASLTSRPAAALKKLHGSRVALVGVGGIGTQVAEHLVGAGLGHIVLIDADRVEESNLNRQYMFDRTLIGVSKVEIARNYLLKRSPIIHIEVFNSFIETVHDLDILDTHPLDIIVNCADQPSDIQQVVANYCQGRNLPFSTSGVGVHRGYWGPLLTNDAGGEYRDFMQRLHNAQDFAMPSTSNVTVCKTSFGPYNSIIAAHLAADVVKLLVGADLSAIIGKRMFLNFKTLTIEAFDGVE